MKIKGYEPKDFNLSRMIRFSVIATITLILIAFIFNVGFASAESGSIIISDDKIYDYDFSGGAAVVANTALWGTLLFNNVNYNQIQSFHFHPKSASYVNSYESTSFTFASGATGSGGWVFYDKNWSEVRYVFNSDMLATSGTIVLSFQKNIFANISGAGGATGTTSTPSPTQPVIIAACNVLPQYSTAGIYHSVTVSLRGTDYYNVTYPLAEHFSVSITKNLYIDSIYIIHGQYNEYSREPLPYNKNNIDNAMFEYKDGIILNTTLSSGLYVKTIVNSTIGEAYKKDLYSYKINYSKSFYGLGEAINLSYQINDNSTTKNNYYIKTTQTDKKTGNYYTNAYQVEPDTVGYYESIGYINPLVYDNMISDFNSCVMQNNVAVYCKSINYGYASDLNISITGNLSLNKNTYNQSEIVEISYNSSINGRIKIINGFKELMNQEVLAGTDKKINYTNNYLDIGQYYVSLEYQLNGIWIILDRKSYITISQLNKVWFEDDTIQQGNNMKIYHIINQSGHLVLKDSASNQIFNFDLLNSNGFTIENNYNNLYMDLTGIWNIYLYDSAMNQLSTDSITVNTGITGTPTPTAIIISTPTSLISLTNDISSSIFGEIGRDDNGKISEAGISDMGDKIFMTLLLFVFVVICLLIFTKKR